MLSGKVYPFPKNTIYNEHITLVHIKVKPTGLLGLSSSYISSSNTHFQFQPESLMGKKEVALAPLNLLQSYRSQKRNRIKIVSITLKKQIVNNQKMTTNGIKPYTRELSVAVSTTKPPPSLLCVSLKNSKWVGSLP